MSCEPALALPDRIRKARKEAGFSSQEALGAALGTTRIHVNAWETGRNAPSYEYAKKLAELLGGEPEHWMAQDGHGPRRRGEAELADAAQSLATAADHLVDLTGQLLPLLAELRSLLADRPRPEGGNSQS